MTAMAAFESIGTRPMRPDGLKKATGQANFGVDPALPRMSNGKVARSSPAHARICLLNTGVAEAMPGGPGGPGGNVQAEPLSLAELARTGGLV